MTDKVAEFRRAAVRRREQGTSARYPEAMKRFALAHAQERMTAGASVQRAAKELGLAGQTLAYWLRTRSSLVRAARERAKLVPVITVPASKVVERSAAILVVAGDVRIEVSDVVTAAELVRRLR
jgi:transposase-like protein